MGRGGGAYRKTYVVSLKQEVNRPITVENCQKHKTIILKPSIIGQFAYCLSLTAYVFLHADGFTMPLLERLSNKHMCNL